MTRFLKLLSPLVGLGCAGVLYWYLNIRIQLFSEKWGLGCGCNEGFNTNHLTYLVAVILLAITGTGCWVSSALLPKYWRAGHLALCGSVLLAFVRQFIHYNLWA